MFGKKESPRSRGLSAKNKVISEDLSLFFLGCLLGFLLGFLLGRHSDFTSSDFQRFVGWTSLFLSGPSMFFIVTKVSSASFLLNFSLSVSQ